MVTATDGESGLMAFTYEHPDLVLLDANLPDRPGLTLGKQIRSSDGGEVPLVVLSRGEDVSTHAAQAATIAPTAVIGKPLDVDALGAALARLSDGDMAAIAKLDQGGMQSVPDSPTHARDQQPIEPLEKPIKPEDVPLKGRLETTPFPVLFSAIYRQKLTGALELSRGRVRKAVFYKEGNPIFARSNAVNELLGNILVKLKKITPQQLEESVKLMKKTKRQQGEILIEMGAITKQELHQGLKAQARAKIYNLFGWERGAYEFHKTAKFGTSVTQLNLRAARILNQGMRQRYKLERLRPLLAPLLPKLARLKSEAQTLLEDAKLTDDEWAFLNDLNGTRALAAVISDPGSIGEARAAQLLYMVFCANLIHLMATPTQQPATEPEPAVEDGVDELILSDMVQEAEAAETPTPAAIAPPTEPRPAADGPDTSQLFAEAERLLQLNHFELLGVTQDASSAEIKSSYFRLAKEWHPDRFADATPEVKNKADEVFSRIGEAHSTLTDADERKRYTDEVIHGISDDASEEANAILNAEHQFLKGERLLDAGNTEKALEAFETAVELYPKEGEYHAYYGWALWKLNYPNNKSKSDLGEKKIRESLKLNSMNGKPHYFLGCIARVKEQYDDAKRHFLRCLELMPDNIDAQRELRLLERREEKKGIGGLFSRFKK